MTSSTSEDKKPRNEPSSASSVEFPSQRNQQPDLPIPPEILSKLPPDIRAVFETGGVQITTEIAASLAMYRGPWPPPTILAEYEALFPGWGQRMLELTEKQVAHRQSLEAKQVDRSERRMDAGQYFGFSVAIASLLAASTIFTFAPPFWATSIAALGIVVVGVGGPTVARVLATKFHWPDKQKSEPEK